MNVFKYAFLLLFMVTSCTNTSDESPLEVYEGKWKLVKMSGSIQNSETTGEQMAWQETYVFNSNGTFLKTRVQNSTITESSGTYTILTSAEDIALELSHATASTIVGSCLGNQKEVLFLQSKDTLSSTWNQCDGPSLYYEKQR